MDYPITYQEAIMAYYNAARRQGIKFHLQHKRIPAHLVEHPDSKELYIIYITESKGTQLSDLKKITIGRPDEDHINIPIKLFKAELKTPIREFVPEYYILQTKNYKGSISLHTWAVENVFDKNNRSLREKLEEQVLHLK